MYGTSVGYGAVAYSSWWHRALLGGGFGVYLFFALSGYLLFLPFARHLFAGGRSVDPGRYARNRALRILPLYYVVALTYLIVLHGPRFDWVVFPLFGENFFLRSVAQLDAPMWSLVDELLYYVLLPLLAAGLGWLSGRSVVRAAAVLVAAAGAAGAYRWVGYLHATQPSPLVRYNLPANFYFFLPGMLLALAKVAWERNGDRPLPSVLGRSWLWVAGSAVLWAVVCDRYQWDLLAGPASFLLIGACVLPLRASAPLRLLGLRPLAVLGTASYSLYLWHLPIVTRLASAPLAGYLGHLVVEVPLTVAVALVSYRVVEEPFLRWRRRWGDTAAA